MRSHSQPSSSSTQLGVLAELGRGAIGEPRAAGEVDRRCHHRATVPSLTGTSTKPAGGVGLLVVDELVGVLHLGPPHAGGVEALPPFVSRAPSRTAPAAWRVTSAAWSRRPSIVAKRGSSTQVVELQRGGDVRPVAVAFEAEQPDPLLVGAAVAGEQRVGHRSDRRGGRRPAGPQAGVEIGAHLVHPGAQQRRRHELTLAACAAGRTAPPRSRRRATSRSGGRRSPRVGTAGPGRAA